MSVTETLEREIEACDARLVFLQRHDSLSDEVRDEIEQRRTDAVDHLARLESERLTDQTTTPN